MAKQKKKSGTKTEIRWKNGFAFASAADPVKVNKELKKLLGKNWRDLIDEDCSDIVADRVYLYARENRKSELTKCFSEFSDKKDALRTLGRHEARMLINHLAIEITVFRTNETIIVNAYERIKNPKTKEYEYIQVVEGLHVREQREAIFDNIKTMLEQVQNKFSEYNKLSNLIIEGDI